jgi:hypothetical protein
MSVRAKIVAFELGFGDQLNSYLRHVPDDDRSTATPMKPHG